MEFFRKTPKLLKSFLKKLLGKNNNLNDPMVFSDRELQIWQKVEPFTMTSLERVVCMIDATEYITTNNIPGAIVECGVWRGGSTMAAAISLKMNDKTARDIYLYDTFDGMTSPDEMDIRHDGVSAEEILKNRPKTLDDYYSAFSPLENVKNNIFSTDYPKDKIHFVVGKVEDTIPDTCPDEIAILRLDTDWYSSTHHELVHLYPKISPGGILIIDDYGWWKGARQAVDEYFSTLHPAPFLNRIDESGRSCVKPFFEKG